MIACPPPFDAIVALVLFGTLPVTIKFISADPDTIGIFRLSVAAAGLFVINWMRGELHPVAPRDLLRLAVLGLFFFGHWITFFISIKISSASIGAIGLSTYGIFLLILGAVFGAERLRPIDAVAVLLAAFGAVLVVPRLDIRNETAMGMLLACISALLYATLPILHQKWSHLPTSSRALGQFSFALLFFLFFLPSTNWNLAPRDWAGLLFLAIGVTLIGHSLWVRVTTRLPPSVTSIIYYGNIPIALLLAVLILDEPVTLRMLAGAALIIGGGILGLAKRSGARTSSPAP